MSEINDYLKSTTLYSKIAEAHLKDAEDELHTLIEKLENCLELMRNVPQNDALFMDKLDKSIHDSQPVRPDEIILN